MGIRKWTRESGKTLYYARTWFEGKEYVEGGFTTRAAAEKAMGVLRKRLEGIKLGEPEVKAPHDPTVRELMGDPDAASGPGAGTYLRWIAMPNNKAPGYVRRVMTAARPLLRFFGDRRVSELKRDLATDYQRQRQTEPLRVGAKAKAAAQARREALGLPAPAKGKAAGKGRKAAKPRLVGPACVNRELLTLRACLSWAADPDRDAAHRIDRNPMAKVPMLREPEPRNPTLTGDDEQRLLAACRPPWLRELVALLLATGMRPGEALALQWGDLNADQRLITVRHSKSNRSRLVPTPGATLAALLVRRPEGNGDSLIFQSRSGKPITSGKAAHHFTPIARALGFAFTLHGCRHVFASRMLSAGASLPQIASVLGHRTLQTSTRYAHARLPDLQVLVDEVAALSRPKLTVVPKEGGVA